jgi:hypothetical protein
MKPWGQVASPGVMRTTDATCFCGAPPSSVGRRALQVCLAFRHSLFGVPDVAEQRSVQVAFAVAVSVLVVLQRWF